MLGSESKGIKIVIVGGVAGGASAAAKARRANEQARIVMFEKGPYVSFANCGLPYYIGGEIRERDSLLLQTPESFWERFRVEVNIFHEVVAIDRKARSIQVRNLKDGVLFDEAYDRLILAPGAGAIIPPLSGIDAKNIFTVKTVPDSEAIRTYIETESPKKAVVIGAGFIGLESAEALKMRGLQVTVIEKLPQVLPVLDSDMASFVAAHLRDSGIHLILGDGIKAFHGGTRAVQVELESGKKVDMDLAILSIGVRPELKLAQDAGLEIGSSGGIAVDEHMRTSDPDIFAAGDAAEVVNLVSGKKTRIPLAGPANKQGRVAGANAASPGTSDGLLTFPGALGTSIVGTMGITAAKTGLSAREAAAAGLACSVSYTHSGDHAGYYPGAEMMHIKLIVENGTGRLLGGQIVGEKGVDKRIDVLATALSGKMTVSDLEDLDLAYAPQFSSAKDPVIMAGFVASNVARQEFKTITSEELLKKQKRKEAFQLVDVRTPSEFRIGHLPGAKLFPVDELRDRIGDLDPSKETVVYCRVGLRGYLATRIMQQNGFKDVFNLTGGILLWPEEKKDGVPAADSSPSTDAESAVLRDILLHGQGLVIDVREEDEFRYEHIKGTKNIPLSRLHDFAGTLPKGHEIHVLCQTGLRSGQAIAGLKNAGFQKVFMVTGGLQAWKKAGYETVKSGEPIPIMRQVQIVAGSLALIGGLFIPLRWVAILVGAGLIFAGVSGFCGMAIVLAKMPWNKVKPQLLKSAAEGGSCKPCA